MFVWFRTDVRGFRRIAGGLVLAGLVSACGQQEPPAPPPAAPAPIATAPASVPSAPPAVAVPDGPPLEFDFIYPGAVEGSSPGVSNSREFGKIYQTSDDSVQVTSYYKEALDDAGWELLGDQDTGVIAIQIFSKDNQTATLFFTRQEEGGTEIMLLVAEEES